jgi:hypothetical protein
MALPLPTVVFRRDEYETIGRCDFGGPLLNDLMFVSWPPRNCRGHGLVEERHWEVAEVEKPSFNRLSLPKLLKDPALSENPTEEPF